MKKVSLTEHSLSSRVVFFPITEKRRKDAVVAATALSHVLVDHLNAG